jgi:hypothetical protein
VMFLATFESTAHDESKDMEETISFLLVYKVLSMVVTIFQQATGLLVYNIILAFETTVANDGL